MGNVGSCISWAPCVVRAPGVSTSYLHLSLRCVLPLLRPVCYWTCALPERLASPTAFRFVKLRHCLLGFLYVVYWGCVELLGCAACRCALHRCLWACRSRFCRGCRVLRFP